jgi:hypothetical protein
VDVATVLQSMSRLQNAHLLVLAPGSARVWMAHPFSAVPTAYGVTVERRRYWANCAWDYLALPSLIGATGAQSARCAQSGEVIEATFAAGRFAAGAGVVHFAVAPKRFWENVAFT